MFPDVGEFNLVVAGLATFAATVGYACTRRLSTSSAMQRPNIHLSQQTSIQTDSDMQVDIDNDVKLADEENEAMTIEHGITVPASTPLNTPLDETLTVPLLRATTPPAPARRLSLKRKVPDDGFDEPKVEDRGYPYNLANIYPNKRSRTPSTDSDPSTPMTLSQRGPSPALESTIDNTFDAVIVSHINVSPASSTIEISSTPATEPPVSPSPIPDAVGNTQEVEDSTPALARARSPTPVSTPQRLPTPDSPVPTLLSLSAEKSNDIPKEKDPEKPLLPLALTPLPVLPAALSAPKPFPKTGFGAFANLNALGASRPTTPKSAFTSSSSGFAAFAGATSPFAAAAVLHKPAVTSTSDGPPKSVFRQKSKILTTPIALPTTNILFAPLPTRFSNISGTSIGGGSISDAEVKPAELHAAEKFLDDVLGSQKTTDKGKDANGAEDIAGKDPKESHERESKEKEDREKEEARRAARAREEQEVREQEKREKRLREEVRKREKTAEHVLLEAKTSNAHHSAPATGEEDEIVQLEQKGVRLFVKRGDRAFSEGIPGLIKVLSNRKTGEERILFRRDLLKVSMNVRVHPTVRITFVPEENVLRCILKESVSAAEAEDGVAKQELAIYVIKPSRSCSKREFKAFAEALMQRSQLKEGAEKIKARSA